jgi:integrase
LKGRKNPFPGVTRAPDRHGKVRWRFRRKKGNIDTYLSGAYGSAEFRAGYEAAISGSKVGVSDPRAPSATMAWLIESYLRSPRHKNKADSTRRVLRLELDWLRDVAGKYPFASFRAKHVEAVMAQKDGPAAQNKARKNFSMLFNYAIKQELLTFNPARAADRRTEKTDGFHTWTAAEMTKFLTFYPSGTKERLVFLLAHNTGAARADLAAMTKGHIRNGRISYRRGKTKIAGTYGVSAELATEIALIPDKQFVLIAHGKNHLAYNPASLGNWFHDRCMAANLPHCSLHGIRKGQATAMANGGGSEFEVMAYLAHATPKEGATYTKNAQRDKLADSGLARTKSAQELSNQPEKLDNKSRNTLKGNK